MISEKVKLICQRYELRLCDLTEGPLAGHSNLERARFMLPRIPKFIEEGSQDKAMRWLGFVQGVLYCKGVYTIEEMREHNRE